MADILIDLGPKWGHIVPLGVLEQISHIQVLDTGAIKVACSIPEGEKIRQFEFQSCKSFDDKALKKEKDRLLGFSNGIIFKEDMDAIMKGIESQTGVKPKEMLKEPMYDVAYLRRVWASIHDEPYFKISLVYDPENANIVIDEDHNDEFVDGVLPEWLSENTLALLPDKNERIMMFAYEAVYNLVEPFMPEGEGGAMHDPNANIPTIGTVGVKQTVDIDKMDNRNVMQTSHQGG